MLEANAQMHNDLEEKFRNKYQKYLFKSFKKYLFNIS